MFKYGIDNVRGSFYQDIFLENFIINNIENELNKFTIKKEINDNVK